MYQFNHYYKNIVNASEYKIVKAESKKNDIEIEVDFICDLISVHLPEFITTVIYDNKKNVSNAGIAHIYVDTPVILFKKAPMAEFKIEFFCDIKCTYYVQIRRGKFQSMYLYGFYFKCFGKNGLEKFFAHFFEWGELFGNIYWKCPNCFKWEDVEFIQLLNSDCSIKLYNFEDEFTVNSLYKAFQFGNNFESTPLIGIKKDGVGEFKVVSFELSTKKRDRNKQYSGLFYAFITTDEYTVIERTIAFCCEGALGLTDLLHNYPSRDFLKTKFWRIKFDPLNVHDDF